MFRKLKGEVKYESIKNSNENFWGTKIEENTLVKTAFTWSETQECFHMSVSFMQRRFLPFCFVQILKNSSQKIFRSQVSKWE